MSNKTSLKTIRQQAAKTIMDLRNGSIEPMVADAIYKQSLAIIDSYRMELRAVELAIQNSKGVDYEDAIELIDLNDKVK